jgi:16S rRNA (cytosine967-C5)-methyltransferase
MFAHLLVNADWPLARLEAECATAKYGPGALQPEERRRLARAAQPPPGEPPLPVRANVPAWLVPHARSAFGAGVEAELQAMNGRAPLDLRVNTLRASRATVLETLASAGVAARPTAHSPWGIRVADRLAVSELPGYRAGEIEVQDEGAQIAALLVDAQPGMRVLDYCAGAGGKTLALAAAMHNRGTLIAHDSDLRRLERLLPRAQRAGASLIRTCAPRELASAAAQPFARVLADVPCTGSGTWRRQPDAKWRLSMQTLDRCRALQRRILDDTAACVVRGGRLIYVTCSFLPDENECQIEDFLSRRSQFRPVSLRELWAQRITSAPPPACGAGLRLTPATSGCDGFFIAALERRA